jgi:hypothetical protein
MLAVICVDHLLHRRGQSEAFLGSGEQHLSWPEAALIVRQQPVDRVATKPLALDPPPSPRQERRVTVDQGVVEIEAGQPGRGGRHVSMRVSSSS